MIQLKDLIKSIFNAFLCSFLIFFVGLDSLSAEESHWIEVANINNESQFIDSNILGYNNKGYLSVLTRYSVVNNDDPNNINTNVYLMAIDCEKRLFAKLPVNGDLKEVKNWTNPINDKLIKMTIIDSCYY